VAPSTWRQPAERVLIAGLAIAFSCAIGMGQRRPKMCALGGFRSFLVLFRYHMHRCIYPVLSSAHVPGSNTFAQPRFNP